MPHASGGGSHGGGSHGSGGGSGGGSAGRIASRPFGSARRYRYYDGRGKEHYVYSEQWPRKMEVPTLIVRILIFIVMGILGFQGVLPVLTRPIFLRQLTPKYVSPEIHFDDRIGAVDNVTLIENSLRRFENQTGISPYIVFLSDSEWKPGSLEAYAYNYYIKHFDDEQHFLIVYSEPENADELEFVDWSWEAVQGNETDAILTPNHFQIFQNDLQQHLEDKPKSLAVGRPFAIAFDNSQIYMMRKDSQYTTEALLKLILPGFFAGMSIVEIVRTVWWFFLSRKKFESA